MGGAEEGSGEGFVETLPVFVALREVVTRPFTAGGFVAALVCALPLLLGLVDQGFLGSLLSAALLAFLYVHVLEHVGRGGRGFPSLPRLRTEDDGVELVRVFGSGACLALVGVLPFVVWRGFLSGDVSEWEIFLAFVVPSFFLPAAIVAVAVEKSPAAAFWPFAWGRIAKASFFEYLKLVIGFATTMIIVGFVQAALELVTRHSPCLAVAIAAVGNLCWFGQATYVGVFVRGYVEDAPVMSARKPAL